MRTVLRRRSTAGRDVLDDESTVVPLAHRSRTGQPPAAHPRLTAPSTNP
jgi:hypothetical protein